MAVVGQVTTPTLVIHSELDFRCPLEQATRYYAALKRQGTEAELLVFPGENHELTRSGQPRHRVERFEPSWTGGSGSSPSHDAAATRRSAPGSIPGRFFVQST